MHLMFQNVFSAPKQATLLQDFNPANKSIDESVHFVALLMDQKLPIYRHATLTPHVKRTVTSVLT